MDDITSAVTEDICQRIDNELLVLPSMPEMALKLRDASEDPDTGLNDLASIIKHDPALTARLIKVVNSTAFRTRQEITDLNMALSRLGMQSTVSIATGLAMEQMFQATSDIIDKRMRNAWSSSSEVAGICHVLCRHCTKLKPDQAALAGLTFQIGTLPILSYAEDHPSLLRDSITLERVIAAAHPSLGQRILKDWAFPAELQNIPVNYSNYSAQKPQADYADIVTVAVLQARPASLTIDDIDYANVTAFARLGLDPDIESAEAENLNEEITSAAAMFG